MSIEITNIQPVNKNSLLARCDVHIKPWKMVLHGVAIFQKGMQRWVTMPSRTYESNGETKYAEQITFEDSSVSKRFREQVMAAIDAYLLANPSMEPKPVICDNEDLPF